jgi:hypothetical protein
LKTDSLLSNQFILTKPINQFTMTELKNKTLIFRIEQEFGYEVFCAKFELEDNEATLKIWEKMFNKADEIKNHIGYVDLPLENIYDRHGDIVGDTIESMYEEVNDTQPCDGCSCELESNSNRTYYTTCGVYCKACVEKHTCSNCEDEEEDE